MAMSVKCFVLVYVFQPGFNVIASVIAAGVGEGVGAGARVGLLVTPVVPQAMAHTNEIAISKCVFFWFTVVSPPELIL
jgi:hypothetical protein